MKIRWFVKYHPYTDEHTEEQPSWDSPVLQFLNDNNEWEDVHIWTQGIDKP